MYRDRDGQPIGLTRAPADQKGNATGFYLMAQQQVCQDSSNSARGLLLFANVIQTDLDVFYVEQAWQAGLFLSAPFDARPKDEIGLAVGGLKVNSMLPIGVTEQYIPHIEYPAELYYGVSTGHHGPAQCAVRKNPGDFRVRRVWWYLV
ncbi:hypothetical protein BOH73_18300 [Pseudomonas versuta]|uniref:Porin n=2 Tax=Pseudomonas versuta TaxID=1788301 RepID=A0ABX3E5U4_9PSED|nr:carbohydrate porin [Pseudomonas versuta]OKA19085.1 hypothetical protein BOH73_18300 [Pseudomonas versuta]